MRNEELICICWTIFISFQVWTASLIRNPRMKILEVFDFNERFRLIKYMMD